MAGIFTNEQAEFVAANVKGRSNQELTNLINNTWGLHLTITQVKTYKKNHKLTSGLTGYFLKGNVPFNKGKKMDMSRRRHSGFKKGYRPTHALPVGSETLDSTGYIKVKVAEPSVWKFKHVEMWEAQYGKRPAGCKLIFADGNRLNVNLDNIIMITNGELMRMNKQHLRFNNAELTRSGAVLAKFQSKIEALRRRKKHE